MIGVNFQPGSQDYGQQNGNAKPSGGSGVQEAIKILSLRLPRVMGAQGATPMPLLTSQGSGGSRVDSIVNQVLSRVMPGQPPPMPMQPASAPSGPSGPSFSGSAQPSYQPQPRQQWTPPANFNPRVIVGGPLPPVHPRTGAPISQPDTPFPTGMFEPLPNIPLPQLPNFDRPIFNPPQSDGGGGGYTGPFDTPMF